MKHPSREDTLVYDVIIAGPGSVGLFLPCELRLAKRSVLVLEQLQDPHSRLKRLPLWNARTLGSNHRSSLPARLLEQIAAESRPAGAPGQSSQPTPGAAQRGPAGHFAGIQFDHSNIDAARWTCRLPGPSSIQLGSAMEHLERVLAAHAISVGVEIQRGHGVDGFETSNDEVTWPRDRLLRLTPGTGADPRLHPVDPACPRVT